MDRMRKMSDSPHEIAHFLKAQKSCKCIIKIINNNKKR